MKILIDKQQTCLRNNFHVGKNFFEKKSFNVNEKSLYIQRKFV